jgi:hypothetical protein
LADPAGSWEEIAVVVCRSLREVSAGYLGAGDIIRIENDYSRERPSSTVE